MTTAALRHKLHDYLEIADTKKIKAIYTMFELEIEETLSANVLTNAQIEEVEERRKKYLSGESKSHDWDNVKDSFDK